VVPENVIRGELVTASFAKRWKLELGYNTIMLAPK